MALVALEDPAPLVDLSENTYTSAAIRQYTDRTGLLKRAKVTRTASPQGDVLHGEFAEQLLWAIMLVALGTTQNSTIRGDRQRVHKHPKRLNAHGHWK